ncbi:MAG TPA: hypothetical protein VID04_04375 [Methylomirabilota bacterium]|jgi:hypothetical protein
MKHLSRRHRGRPSSAATTFEALSTHELLALHERHFGALDPKARTRILEATRARGWTDGWPAQERLAA